MSNGKIPRQKDELILRIVRFMESNGGCIDFEDKPEFDKRFPNVKFKDDGSRNDGLVAISEQVMDKQDTGPRAI